MCGIIATLAQNTDLVPLIKANATRGRDSWGVWTPHYERRSTTGFSSSEAPMFTNGGGAALANLRAEPTTEWVLNKTKADVQPYRVGNWVVVHNGTVANDKELCTKYDIKNRPTRIDSWVIAALLNKFDDFRFVIQELIGSYAICAVNINFPSIVNFAVNYRPLYLHNKLTLSSVQLDRDDFLITPYSFGTLTKHNFHMASLLQRPAQESALVVCSGGLDSTVAAAVLKHQGYKVELLHFDYGCRATQQETQAIHAIAAALDVKLNIVKTDIFTDIIKGSPLTNTTRNEAFAEGEAGAEYAHEWVPSRNLIMLSIATGIAESRGFNVLALGANLEEAGAYPDNEPEFYNRFSHLLPFAVRDGTQLRIEMPVGNLMKWEIVKLGLEVNAPLHLTWSCYNNGNVHCKNCGPCHMRRIAFEMNGAKDPVFQ